MSERDERRARMWKAVAEFAQHQVTTNLSMLDVMQELDATEPPKWQDEPSEPGWYWVEGDCLVAGVPRWIDMSGDCWTMSWGRGAGLPLDGKRVMPIPRPA